MPPDNPPDDDQSDDNPPDNRPAADNSPDDRPAGDNSPDDRPADDRPADDQPTTGPVRSTSVRLVEAVADATKTNPVELPTLLDVIDADALDDLFPADGSGNCRAAFEYASMRVSIDTNGRIGVQPADSTDE